MIKITTQNNNIAERKYILDIVFNEWLGLEYHLDTNGISDEWIISIDKKTLHFKDSFFSKHINGDYISQQNIPNIINYTTNEFIQEINIPIIYGSTKIIKTMQTIQCDIDIFASIFFMLSRWEEIAITKRDMWDRFSAKDSLAYKMGFLDRPIVNEYIMMLKNMILFCNNNISFKNMQAKTIVTCDCDEPWDPTSKNIYMLIRASLGDIIKRRNILGMLSRCKRYIYNKIEYCKYNDPHYTFEYYMSTCEKINLKAKFYFICDNSEANNGHYNMNETRVIKLLQWIHSRGHEIGTHGSINTYKNKTKIINEKEILKNICIKNNITQEIIGNRQHYLRWDSAITPSVLNSAGYIYDTSGSYADCAGFRYGVCYEFSMFDILSKSKLDIKQSPLIVMECSVLDKKYMNLDYKEALKYMKQLKEKCYKYNGNFVLLWHNSAFETQNDKILFEKIIQYLIH